VLTTAGTRNYGTCTAGGDVAGLLTRVSQNDPAAWEEIIRRYSGVVFAKIRSFRLQDADALDAAQMTWLRLAENAHRIQIPDHLGGWLATTASRECLRILRHHTRQTPTPPLLEDNIPDPAPNPEQHAIDADIARTLWNLVAELPPRRRTLLRALFTDNPRPYTEVAHTTGIPAGGIGPTRARALEQLRRRLDEHGLGLDEHGLGSGD
jgi:RNA polymerase sigma factor (sigma-70 family)